MKTFEYGLPCTPAKKVSAKIKDATQYFLTYGGGIGGGNMTLYALKSEELPDGFIKLKLYDGETTTINKQFIVKITPVLLLTTVFDTTAHWNYREHRCKKCIHTEIYWLHLNEDVVYKNDYISMDDELVRRRIANINDML